MQSGGGPRQSGGSPQPTISLSGISLQEISRLLGSVSAGASINVRHFGDEDDDDEEDDGDEGTEEDAYYDSFRQASQRNWFPPVTEPQKEGTELLTGGDFGRVANKLRSRRKHVNVAKFLLNRASRPQPSSHKEDYADVGRPPGYRSLPLLIHISRISYQTRMVPQSLPTMPIFIPANSLQVDRAAFLLYLDLIFLCSDSSFYYTCSQGNTSPWNG
jgi:hypothetical protein